MLNTYLLLQADKSLTAVRDFIQNSGENSVSNQYAALSLFRFINCFNPAGVQALQMYLFKSMHVPWNMTVIPHGAFLKYLTFLLKKIVLNYWTNNKLNIYGK